MAQALGERIGCSTLSYHMLPFEAALSRIRARGLRLVDIAAIAGLCEHAPPLGMRSADRVRWAQTVHSMGLEVMSLNVGHGPFNVEDGLEERKQYVRSSLDLAGLVRASVVTIPTGRRVAPGDWLDHAKRVSRTVREFIPQAVDAGVTLSVEAPHVNSLCSTVNEAVRFLELVGDGRLTLTFDTSHVHVGGDLMRNAVGKMGPWLGHVHLRDCRGRDTAVTPGDGDLSFRDLFSALSGRRYEGGIAVELLTPDATPDIVDREVIRALTHLRGVLGGG